MLTLVCLSLLLAGFFALVSSKHTPSSTTPTVYNDCLGDYSFPLPSGAASTSHFKPQGSVNTNEGDTGWEEWLVSAHSNLTSGLDITYGYRWSVGIRLLSTFRTRRSLLGRISPTERFITAACTTRSSMRKPRAGDSRVRSRTTVSPGILCKGRGGFPSMLRI